MGHLESEPSEKRTILGFFSGTREGEVATLEYPSENAVDGLLDKRFCDSGELKAVKYDRSLGK